MVRKLMIVLASAAVIAAMATPTEVSARGWRGHGGWHGGWRGGGWGGWRGGWGYYGYYPYAAGYYPYAYGCYRNVRVVTPYGWTWRRVWVCG